MLITRFVRLIFKLQDNPNAYYYRFNAPGEAQKNGAWQESERALFMARRDEIGCDGRWGLFSMVIPGRVGYQCSNFYRQLIKDGVIEDPNYWMDDKGKLHYKRLADRELPEGGKRKASTIKRGKRQKKNSLSESFEEAEAAAEESGSPAPGQPAKPAAKKGKGKKAKSASEDADSDDEDRKRYENPLPGFVDPITLEEVIRPAISPYGHVMSYKSWVRCLAGEPKNICPITKQPLTHRQLVILTFENIKEFKSVMQEVPL